MAAPDDLQIPEQNGKASNSFYEKLKEAIKVLEKVFTDYQMNQVFLSFNGGKDCTLLLHLVTTFLQKHFNNETEQPAKSKLFCIHVQSKCPFDEIEKFVEGCRHTFNIEMKTETGDIKSALSQQCQENPNLKACLMGCRRTDPHCSDLNVFQPTDPGWPPLMRINPLLDWTCDDVWKYIEMFNVPYCSLYSQGYTSIGDKINTKPNPHLRYIDPSSNKEMYKHARELRNMDHLERAGRL